MACSRLYRIHDHSTSDSRGLTRALSTLRGVPSLNLRRRSPSGRRFYKAPMQVSQVAFCTGSATKWPVERVIQGARARCVRRSEPERRVYAPGGWDKTLRCASAAGRPPTRCHCIDLSFLLSDFGSNFVRKMAVSKRWLIQI